ncbi:efflux RND transporter permease subunit [Microlunatus panaciterrae]|uniref:HAE1 family hydrophobic/amphiphilic exporter-1 n=1 Tax=Microlunatus panaciterrae TaxID=400768 RepID=A0ABS2RJR6_9ACTN|nr:efflux RND transporter permease subunit [Microlunatus panaciterrae]MBM7799217.1 HAE1 family hydrophobic/amphiphilic exporter-1 [Microlunatus panaciterrae]
MSTLAHLSLRNRALIALVTVFVMIFGVITTTQLKRELIPSLTIPTAVVYTTYPGASPQVVEERVTVPVEQAVLGLSGLESSSSTSSTGVSAVTVNMTYGTNMSTVQQDLQAAISRIKALLPDEADSQVITGSIDDFPVLQLSVTDEGSKSALAERLKTVVVPELEKVDGVRAVSVAGAPQPRVQIDLDLKKLTAAGLAPTAVTGALGASGAVISAGTLTEGSRTLAVTVGKRLRSAADVAGLPMVNPRGQQTTIGDVAKVTDAVAPATSVARTNGKDSLSLSITKTPDGNTVDVSDAVNAALPDLAKKLGKGAAFTTVFDQAPFITQSIDDLTTEGGLGLLMAVIVILVFLLSVRATLVTAISIPVSVLITMIGLRVSDYSLNILTLGALTIAIGRVVDDSIVVIENIKRHLSYGEPKLTAILTAVREVASAITAATMTTVAVFLPIGLVGGQVGELFRPFAVTVGLALLASLLVSLTIVPVLAYWFLRSPGGRVVPAEVRHRAEEKERTSILQRGYLPLLRRTIRHPVITLLLAAVILGGTVALTPLLQTNFLGSSGQNTLTVRQQYEPSLSLDSKSDEARKVEQAIRDVHGVVTVQTTVGSSGGAEAAFGGSSSDSAIFSVTTDEKVDQATIEADVRASLDRLPNGDALTVSASDSGFGSNAVEVVINAPDSGRLSDAATAVLTEMKKVPGVAEVSSSLSADQPMIQVSVDRAKAAKAGVSDRAVAQTLKGVLAPATVGSIETGGSTQDVVLSSGDVPVSLDELRDLMINSSTGQVKLRDVARVEEVKVATSVAHTDGQRSATVSLTPAGENLREVNAAVTQALTRVDLPEGVDAKLGGVTADQADAFTQLGLALLVAIAIVYVVMVATFKSLIQPLILLVSVPFAATGALLALLITGTPLGVPSLIGLLMLVGIVVTNAIVLIDLVNHYRTAGQSIEDALINGARQRLRPILMTAVATIMALTPMALGVTGGGVFISQPLAIVVIGGLISSTALTLVLVPVLYELVETTKRRRAERRGLESAGAEAAPRRAAL